MASLFFFDSGRWAKLTSMPNGLYRSHTDYTSYLDPAIHKEDDVRGAYTLLFSPGLRWITIPNFISWYHS